MGMALIMCHFWSVVEWFSFYLQVQVFPFIFLFVRICAYFSRFSIILIVLLHQLILAVANTPK
jgi:hypothetical protein